MRKSYQAGDLVCLKDARTQEVFTVTKVAPLSLSSCEIPPNNKIPIRVECGRIYFWLTELEPKPIQVGDLVRSVWEVDFDTYEVVRVGDEVLDLRSKALNCLYKDTAKHLYLAFSPETARSQPEPTERNTSPLSLKLAEIRAELDKFEAGFHTDSGSVDPHANDKIRALLDVAESLVEINLAETHDDPDKGIYETLSSVLSLRGRRWDYLR